MAVVVVVAAAVAASCARTILFQEALPPRLRLAMGKGRGKIKHLPLISQIMSTLINVINNGDSEMRKSELLEFFRFHNRKLLKFGIF